MAALHAFDASCVRRSPRRATALALGFALLNGASACVPPVVGSFRSEPFAFDEGSAVLALRLSSAAEAGAVTGALTHSAERGGCVTVQRVVGRWVYSASDDAAQLTIERATLTRNGCDEAARNTFTRATTPAETDALDVLLRGPARVEQGALRLASPLGTLVLAREL